MRKKPLQSSEHNDTPASVAAGSRLSRSAFIGSATMLLLPSTAAYGATSEDAASPDLAARDAGASVDQASLARLDAMERGRVEKAAAMTVAGGNEWQIARTATGRPAGEQTGFFTNALVYDGTVDPMVGMGTFNAKPGHYASALQLEHDWDCGPVADGPHVTELYWQISKPDGASRRPLYGMYDRTNGRTHGWWFMIGNGKSDTGAQPGGFFVNWDNDTVPVGSSCFSVTPNRMSLYPVSTGGVAPSDTRLRMYSAHGKGSGIGLSYNASDPESLPATPWSVRTINANYAIMYAKSSPVIKLANYDAEGAWNRGQLGFFGTEPILQPVVAEAATDAATTQALANSLRTQMVALGLVKE